jgi:hypothetical protein
MSSGRTTGYAAAPGLLSRKRLSRAAWNAAAVLYGHVHDAAVGLKEWKRVRDHAGFPEAGREAMRTFHGAQRLAGFVIHPRYVEFSIRNAVSALAASGFRIAALASEPVPEDLAAFIRAHGGEIVQRQRIGHDVGGYRDFMTYLDAHRDAFLALEWVVLLNDSVYWPRATEDHIRALLSADPSWACLTESFVPTYHAQSYLLCLSRSVAFSRACRQYWANYRPFSYRRHVIQHGEIGFSRLIARAFGKPHCLLSGGKVIQRLDGTDSNADAGLEPAIHTAYSIDMQSGDPAWAGLPDHTEFESQKALTASGAERLRITMARGIARVAMTSNPTHSLGLTLNHLYHAPTKRDLAWRGTHPIGFVPWAVKSYSDTERLEIEHDLRARGLPSDLSMLDRLLVTTGRR